MQFSKHVLVVDDESLVLGFVTEILEEEGLIVRTAATVGEALKLLLNLRFAYLVCDLRLGPEDGMEIIKFAAKNRLVDRLVAISGFSPQLESCKQLAPECAFLAKPFRREELLQVLGLTEQTAESDPTTFPQKKSGTR